VHIWGSLSVRAVNADRRSLFRAFADRIDRKWGRAARVRRGLYRLGKGIRALRVAAALEHGFLHRLGINVTFEVLFAPYSLRSTFAHLAVADFN
jgi:hypothetical protein